MATAFIGLVCFAFIFTGVDFGQNTGDTVATVNGGPIKLEQYRRAFARQLDFYKRMTRKEEVTQKEIESSGLQQQAINGLIDSKLMESLATDMGLELGKNELQDEIKNLPYFKSGGIFDVTLYKALLARNNYSPADFESQIVGDMKLKKLTQLFNSIPFSKGYLETYQDLKNKKVTADIVQINRADLEKRIPVSAKEVADYLAKEENLKTAEGVFQSRKSSLDRKEEVQASHILFKTSDVKKDAKAQEKKANATYKKLTPKNFAKMANKLTEDPSGKGKGGSLGWFQRGRMVPDFEKQAFSQKVGTISRPIKTPFGYHIIYVSNHRKPVNAKFADHKNKIAKELVQKSKKDKVQELMGKLKKDSEKFLSQNRMSKLEPLKKKFKLVLKPKTSIQLIDGSIPGVYLKDAELAKLFDKKNFKTVQAFGDDQKATLIYVHGTVKTDTAKKVDPKEELKRSLQTQQYSYRTKLRQALLKRTKDKAKIKIDDRLL